MIQYLTPYLKEQEHTNYIYCILQYIPLAVPQNLLHSHTCVWSRPANPQPIQPQPIHTGVYSVIPGTPQPESIHPGVLLRHFVGSQALKPL